MFRSASARAGRNGFPFGIAPVWSEEKAGRAAWRCGVGREPTEAKVRWWAPAGQARAEVKVVVPPTPLYRALTVAKGGEAGAAEGVGAAEVTEGAPELHLVGCKVSVPPTPLYRALTVAKGGGAGVGDVDGGAAAEDDAQGGRHSEQAAFSPAGMVTMESRSTLPSEYFGSVRTGKGGSGGRPPRALSSASPI